MYKFVHSRDVQICILRDVYKFVRSRTLYGMYKFVHLVRVQICTLRDVQICTPRGIQICTLRDVQICALGGVQFCTLRGVQICTPLSSVYKFVHLGRCCTYIMYSCILHRTCMLIIFCLLYRLILDFKNSRLAARKQQGNL